MAGTGGTEFLADAAVYLGATAVAVPLFKKLKLGTILGFLAAGVLLGPSVLDVISSGEGVFQIAELGVVLFLFVIGLELSVPRLWSLRRTIFGLGLLQMVITGSLFTGLLFFTGVLTTGPAAVAGFAFACSSTAFALSLMQERGELNTPYGTKALSVLLLQDIAVIPLLAAIPFVAQSSSSGEGLPIDWLAIGKAVGAILVLIIGGRFVLNRFFRVVAVSGSREAFTAAALFVVAVTSLLVAGAGLSMALGAFIAGVLLAESSFKHQIESDIEPFRELLLGLFFIGVGSQLDLALVLQSWWIVVFGAVALIVLKSIILYGLAKAFGADTPTAFRVAGVLSQGGEFGFVVFSLGAGEGLFSDSFVTVSSAVVTISMVATPVIMMAISKLRFAPKSTMVPDVPDGSEDDVLVIGYGRMGQIISQMLIGSNIGVTAIDNDPRRIETAREFGAKVFYGDGTNVNLLLTAGALTADAVIFAIDDKRNLKEAIAALRARCPKVRIVVRAFDRLHEIEISDEDIDFTVRETFESAITMSKKTLSFLGRNDGLIEEIEAEFREMDKTRLRRQAAEGIHAGRERMYQLLPSQERRKESA
ncbi:MAG: monovalent cation:proton antiporter-2 (CPA2) family protein [Pseudomonadota bacterium]